MKVYVICFDHNEIFYSKVFLNKEKAEERLKIMQDEMDAAADKHQSGRYSHLYSVDEMEVEE